MTSGAKTTVPDRADAPGSSLLDWVGIDATALEDDAPTSPQAIERPLVATPDDLDELDAFDYSNALDDLLTMEQILRDAETDAAVADMVERFHLRDSLEDRFEALYREGTAQALVELMARFDIGPESAVCDLGCGIGWLAHALDRLGFARVTAMDTSDGVVHHLRAVAGNRIDIITDLAEWRRIRHRFDALVSVATVHHWHHIPLVALEARRTMRPGAYWFASMEWFADTPSEFVDAMTTHPTRTRYRAYEWAYPASAYVDLIASVGFTLAAVVPMYYRSSKLLPVRPPLPAQIDQGAFDAFVDSLLREPRRTVELFWAEVDARRRAPEGPRLFTRPQVFVFRRAAL